MQSVSSRTWTRIGVSISYDDNIYTTGTSKNLYLYLTELLEIEMFLTIKTVFMLNWIVLK